jgi:stage II sporulation protein D
VAPLLPVPPAQSRRAVVSLARLVAACATPQPAPAPSPPPPPPPTAPAVSAEIALDAGTPSPAAVVPLDIPPPPSTRRLDVRSGEPTVPVRIMEGKREVVFLPLGPVRILLPGTPEKRLEAPARTLLRVRWRSGTPAERTFRIQVAELAYADKEGIASERAEWEARGFTTRLEQLGQVYGIVGKIIDNRRTLVLLEPPLDAAAAAKKQAELLRKHGIRTLLAEEVRRPATVELSIEDADGTPLGSASGPVRAETLDGAGFEVRSVEFGIGYPNHGVENRSYRGALSFAADVEGTLAVVNLVSLEDLLRGLVPSEIFAAAPAEALRAQAVTARGEVLAKVGTRHLADPYLLCSEQHCAVYRGRSGEAPSTNAAVEATRGEALFSTSGRLVDSVYSAVCGGHTENNEAVWGGVPDPSLRGKPDVLEPVADLPDPQRAPARFLAFDLPAACRKGRFAQPGRYRWERRFTAEQLDALAAPLGVGAVQHLQPLERGVSGRVRLLLVSGSEGATELRGELTIRKRFGMLNSALFTVSEERDEHGRPAAFVFRGGGWGHGVGMCQTGAIGRAEAGQDYRAILRHYFNGAEVARIYE